MSVQTSGLCGAAPMCSDVLIFSKYAVGKMLMLQTSQLYLKFEIYFRDFKTNKSNYLNHLEIL